MNSDLISIIIPAYNIEKYIGRCLDSVLNQTYSNLEILVVNDGSTDSTKEIIDEYANKDKRIIAIHKENGGVSSARLEGIQRSTGDYIGFVDGDDVIDEDMYEFLLINLKENDADISHCGYVMEFPDGHKDYYYNTNKKVIQDNYKGLYDLLTGEYVEPGLVIKLYKRDIVLDFDKHEIWDNSIKYNEDVLMNFILFSKSRLSVYEDKCKYHYMLRKGSATTSKSNRKKYEDPMNVMDNISSSVDQTDLINIAFRRYIRCLMKCSTQNDYKDLKVASKKKLKEKIKEGWNLFSLPKKEILMGLAIVYCEPLYKIVRILYDFKTGNYKKYKV